MSHASGVVKLLSWHEARWREEGEAAFALCVTEKSTWGMLAVGWAIEKSAWGMFVVGWAIEKSV